MLEREEFQIIKIISRYRLIINGGTEKSLSEGDEVEVFVKGDELFDQFNEDALLGTLDLIKAKLTVLEVYPKFSVCVNEVVEHEEESTALGLAHLMQPKIITKSKNMSINVKPEDITGGYPEVDKQVVIGDKVRVRYI